MTNEPLVIDGWTCGEYPGLRYADRDPLHLEWDGESLRVDETPRAYMGCSGSCSVGRQILEWLTALPAQQTTG